MKKTQSTDLLEKLLGLVPIIAANPGIALDELRRIADFKTKKEVREGLGKLMMFGVPPFLPNDMIDIVIDDDECVDLTFPQGLERPFALTPSEWGAVQKTIIQELNFQRMGQEGRSHLKEILNSLSDVPVAFENSNPFQNKHRLVEEALEEVIQIEFRYRTLSSKEPEIRRVEPWAVFQHRKVEYLIGYCHLRNDARYFHLERMDNIEILDLPQESKPPEDLQDFIKESPIFQDNPPGFTVTLAFAPTLRPALEQYFRIYDSTPYKGDLVDKEGWFQASCKVGESIWFRSTLRTLGPDVAILAPTHLRESYREELEQINVPEGF